MRWAAETVERSVMVATARNATPSSSVVHWAAVMAPLILVPSVIVTAVGTIPVVRVATVMVLSQGGKTTT